MPIAGVCSTKSPDETFEGQSGLHWRVIGNIDLVIILQKFMSSHLPKDRKDSYDEKETNEKFQNITTH
jgi:hypothetical protein